VIGKASETLRRWGAVGARAHLHPEGDLRPDRLCSTARDGCVDEQAEVGPPIDREGGVFKFNLAERRMTQPFDPLYVRFDASAARKRTGRNPPDPVVERTDGSRPNYDIDASFLVA
jgi:hypothetical protein